MTKIIKALRRQVVDEATGNMGPREGVVVRTYEGVGGPWLGFGGSWVGRGWVVGGSWVGRGWGVGGRGWALVGEARRSAYLFCLQPSHVRRGRHR